VSTLVVNCESSIASHRHTSILISFCCSFVFSNRIVASLIRCAMPMQECRQTRITLIAWNHTPSFMIIYPPTHESMLSSPTSDLLHAGFFLELLVKGRKAIVLAADVRFQLATFLDDLASLMLECRQDSNYSH